MIQISEVYCLNEIGSREQNEDAVWPIKNSASIRDRLFIVCDGVGGSNSGEIAAAFTCECFADYFLKNLQPNESPGKEFIDYAHNYTLTHFKNHIEQYPSARDMSTTLTLIYLNTSSVTLAWCGDSRICQIRNGEIIFQSKDHSLVNHLVESGEITEQEAVNHPQRNIILRAIQYKEKPSEIESVELTDIRSGDFLLLCTDGLLENITSDVLKNLLKEGNKKNYDQEINTFCKGKTKDNYSIYLVKLNSL